VNVLQKVYSAIINIASNVVHRCLCQNCIFTTCCI